MQINWDEETAPTNRKRTQHVLLIVATVPLLIIIAVLFTQRSTPNPVLTSAPATSSQTPTSNVDGHHLPVPEIPLPPLPNPVPAPTEPMLSEQELFQRTAIEGFAVMLASGYVRSPSWLDKDLVIEQIAVEQIDTTSPSVTIVTVMVSYRSPTDSGIFRLAVPIIPNDVGGLSVLPIYPIPGHPSFHDLPNLDHLTPLNALEPARAALDAAGFSDITDVALLGAPGWPTFAFVTLHLPNGPQEIVVLLHETNGGYAVAGLGANKPSDSWRSREVVK